MREVINICFRPIAVCRLAPEIWRLAHDQKFPINRTPVADAFSRLCIRWIDRGDLIVGLLNDHCHAATADDGISSRRSASNRRATTVNPSVAPRTASGAKPS